MVWYGSTYLISGGLDLIKIWLGLGQQSWSKILWAISLRSYPSSYVPSHYTIHAILNLLYLGNVCIWEYKISWKVYSVSIYSKFEMKGNFLFIYLPCQYVSVSLLHASVQVLWKEYLSMFQTEGFMGSPPKKKAQNQGMDQSQWYSSSSIKNEIGNNIYNNKLDLCSTVRLVHR